MRGSIRTTSNPIVRSAGDTATDLIRSAILDGRLQPGERLTEDTVANDLGISRTPVREALRILQAEGLLESIPYHGSRVRTYALEDLVDTYELRAVLEGFAARRAGSRIGPDDIAKLRESYDRFKALGPSNEGNLKLIVEENMLFHATILAAAGSERLTEMVRKITELPLVYQSYTWSAADRKQSSEQAHLQLTIALEKGDPDRAEAIMRDHILEARDVLVAHYPDSIADTDDETEDSGPEVDGKDGSNAKKA
jgi:DNA-binding GntR family transcriptional regulator